MAIFHKDGTVTHDRSTIVGTWWRNYNGLVDRGVRLGNWVGKTASGETAEFSEKRALSQWFDQHTKEPEDDRLMTGRLIDNLKRHEVDRPAPCGLVRAARSEIERLRDRLDQAGERAAEWVNGEAHPEGVSIWEYVTQGEPSDGT